MSGYTSKTPYKMDFEQSAVDVIKARSGVKNISPRIYSSARTPAWIELKGSGLSLSSTKEGFEKTYTNGSFKIGPIVNALTIKIDGGNKFLTTVSAQINCFTKKDFEDVQKAFGPKAKIEVSFGYAKSYIDGESNHGGEIKELYVATYEFSTSEDGVWEYKFTALSPGIAIFDFSMLVGVFNPNFKMKFKTKDGDIPVTGIEHLITWHAQVNGSKSIDDCEDGQIITIPNNSGHVIIFDNRHLIKNMADGVFKNVSNAFFHDEVSNTQNQVYVTLEYIVKEIFNNHVRKIHENKSGNLPADVKIEFHPEYSFSYVSKRKFKSAWPANVLFLGNGWGNYYSTLAGEDLNETAFETRSKNNKSIQCFLGNADTRFKLDLKKILIHRYVVGAALRTQEVDKPGKDNEPTENSKEEMNVNTFFKYIFNEINKASGGWMKLALASTPKSSKNDKEGYKLFVIDENNGWSPDPMPCYVFNPIDGDGNTTKCSLQSDAGSNEYKSAIFQNTSQVSKVLDYVHKSGNSTNSNSGGYLSAVPAYAQPKAKSEYERAIDALDKLFMNPGSVAGRELNPIECAAAEEQLGKLKQTTPDFNKMDILMYPGIKIDLEMYGTFGIYPSVAIMSTQMPEVYFNNGVYFWVESVEHTITDKSEWTTKITGLQSIVDLGKIKYIYL